MEETNYISIQEEIDGLELLLSVYDKSDSKYIDIEETINGLTELQELYKTEELVYKPKIVTDGDSYKYLTKPSEKYKEEPLISLYKILEDIVEDKVSKRKKVTQLRTRLDLIDIELIELKSFVNKYSKEISYGLLWYNKSVGFKSLKLDLHDYLALYNSETSMDDFVIEFNRMPFEQKKVITIKRRGNFLTNKDEIKLVKSFAGKDDLRPVLQLINTQDNYAISTDTYTLVGLYDKDIPDKEQKYSVIDGRLSEDESSIPYPQWKQVIPYSRQFTNQIKIDASSLYNYLNKAIDYGTLALYSNVIDLRLGNNRIFSVSGVFLKNAIGYFIKLGYQKVYLNYSEKESQAIVITASENNALLFFKQDFALLMRVISVESNKMYINLVSNENFSKGGSVELEKKGELSKMIFERRGY